MKRNNYLAVGLTVVVLLLTCFEQQVKAQTLSAADVDIGWTLLNGALVMFMQAGFAFLPEYFIF